MAIIDYFPASVAADINGNVARNAEANVYALSDTSFSTPLAITDLQGVPMAKLTASAVGIFPPFRVVNGTLQIVAVSGDLKTPMTSLAVYAAAAETGAQMAATSAGAANSAAATAASARADALSAAAAAAAVGNTNDTIIEGRIKATGSKTELALRDKIAAVGSAEFASRYTTAATQAATKRLMMKLARGVEDTSILAISDSTGNGPDEWVYLSTLDLAARFPTISVVYHLWDVSGAGAAWLPAQTVQTGTSGRTLHVWNAAASGESTTYFTTAARYTLLLATAPDLIFVSHGHNQGDPTSPDAARGYDHQRNAFLELTEELALRLREPGIVLIGQNPTLLPGREKWQAIKAAAMEEAASWRGYGFIDVHQGFIDYSREKSVPLASMLDSEGIHPTPAMQAAIWAPLVISALQVQPGAAMLTRPANLLTASARNILGSNFDFSDWPGAAPAGWSVLSGTASKNAAQVEMGSWSAQVTPAGSGESGLEKAGSPSALGFPGALAGQAITLAVRYFAAVGAQAGSIVITDQRGSAARARHDLVGMGRWHWAFVTMRLADPTTTVSFKLLSRVSGSGTSPYSFDRAFVVLGSAPAAGGSPAAAGTQGVPGDPTAGQRDHLSTFGDNPMVTLLASGGAAGPFAVANDAQLVKVRPHRNMTLAKLIWRCSAGGGNYDIAIYDSAGTRLWSRGSTASPSSGATVTETVSPSVSLTAGNYYWVAIAADGTVFSPRGNIAQDGELAREMNGSYGAVVAGSSFPLPATMSIPAAKSNRIPVIVLAEA